jgi:aldose 1-epimerase
LSATTDRPTFLNLANHSYWNLDATPTFKGHKLQVMANTYLPTTDAFIPTGAIAPVEGTPFDLRNARDVVPAHADGFDNNFCVSSERRDLTHVATLTGQTGIGLEMWTTEPGLQVYDARAQGSGAFAGLNGAPYQNYCGLALEAQMWPNAPNEPAFPSIEITPDAAYRQITQWRFTQ